MKRPKLLHRPAMVGEPCCHGRRRLWGTAQTLMRHAKILDRPHHAHPLVQCQGLACQRPAPNVALSRSMYAVLLTPSPCERRLSVSTRAGVPSTRRRSVSTTRRRSSRLTTWALRTLRQGRSRGRPPVPVRMGSRQVARIARMDVRNPSVQHNSGRGAAQRRTRSISRRIRGRSRCSLTSPPSHRRVCTIRAMAIQTIPPCFWTRSSSACTCPRSRGGSTRDSCTAWPCRPERVHQSALVRSSKPNAATSACTGHPWASNVTTRRTVSAAVRRRYNTVPVVALHVLWHAWQMNRCSFCEWRPILPLPVWPLAGQVLLGQNVVVGSMTLLLAVRGNIATRSMSRPPFAVQLHRTTVWCEATLRSVVLYGSGAEG